MAGLVFVFFRTFPVPGPGVVQAIAFTIHLEDRDMVHETIEWCAGQPFGAEHARPILKGQIQGHNGRAMLVPLAEHLEW